MERTGGLGDSLAAPGRSEPPRTLLCPGMYVFPTMSTVGTIFKDTQLCGSNVV